MKKFANLLLFASICLSTSDTFAASPDAKETEGRGDIEIVTVTGVKAHETLLLAIDETTQPGLDNSDLLRLFPGGNRNANGPMSRISQYRGLFGAQNTVLIDGLEYTPGGPNWMDSPLSSIPQALTRSITLHRGLGSVAIIDEGLGGAIEIHSRKGGFTTSQDWSDFGLAEAAFGHNASHVHMSLYAGEHNQSNWITVAGSLDQGNDYQFADGDVAATEFDREQYRLGYGHRFDSLEITLATVVNRTGNSGTPALPMDIRDVDSEQYSLGLDMPIGEGNLSFKINILSVDHRMNNFTLRPVPVNAMGMRMARQTMANSDSGDFKLVYDIELLRSQFLFGFDGQRQDHDADITNPENSVFNIENFNQVERDRIGWFIQSSTTLGAWDLEGGLRYNRVKMNAGEVSGNLALVQMGSMSPASMPTAPVQQVRLDVLAAQFNSADRKKHDDQWSGVLKASHSIADSTRLNLALGRKARSPSYQERYLWLPLESTAGLADGFTYIGDIDLKPETSIEVTAGIEWSSGDFLLSPEFFYRDVKNYIQGIASTNQTANMFAMMLSGAKPLQFANVDAELYGADLSYQWTITQAWLLRGNLSYVRGRRSDVNDDLYRIAPISSFMELSYVHDRLFLSAESVAAAKQNKVAEFNDEKRSAGWGIVNLRGGFELSRSLNITLGVENIFDKAYQDHLGGFNRVRESDIPVGERIYSEGRNFYVKVNAGW